MSPVPNSFAPPIGHVVEVHGPRVDDLIAYLTDNCCQGRQRLPTTAVANTTTKRRRGAGKPERRTP